MGVAFVPGCTEAGRPSTVAVPPTEAPRSLGRRAFACACAPSSVLPHTCRVPTCRALCPRLSETHCTSTSQRRASPRRPSVATSTSKRPSSPRTARTSAPTGRASRTTPPTAATARRCRTSCRSRCDALRAGAAGAALPARRVPSSGRTQGLLPVATNHRNVKPSTPPTFDRHAAAAEARLPADLVLGLDDRRPGAGVAERGVSHPILRAGERGVRC